MLNALWPARTWRRAVMMAWLITMAGALGAHLRGQEVTLTGRVVERGTREAVAAATVTLSGAGSTITNPDGVFVFARLKPGRRTLSIAMLGYRRREIRVNAEHDTTLQIELEVEAVRVNPLDVRSRVYSVRGLIKEAANGRPVMNAEIHALRRTTRSNSGGRYRVSRVPVGPRTLLEVWALGLMPVQVMADAERDTTINFLLEADPIGRRMMEIQIEKLDTRLRALPYATDVKTRDELLQRFYNYNVGDIMRMLTQTMLHTPGCLLLDERPTSMPELIAFLPDQIERIEFIDRGSMVRIYTRGYVQDMMRGRAWPAAAISAVRGSSMCA